MKNKDKLLQIYQNIDYDINTVWDDSYEDYDYRTDLIKSILSFFDGNKEVKEELLELIKYYVYRLYEESD
ncbi:MAG: hypothetical protein IJI98_11180 [Methanosphaera sp.]|nr:hypothetical protein [Methanobrevibacter sp.]MBQ6754200.1 hypothetical protein [Bacteroidales bacterium]MBR0351358.1 hypothetical protein [Clostridia bacterium]MBR0473242.1 hypothetical protein [Methanosphaera sp.]